MSEPEVAVVEWEHYRPGVWGPHEAKEITPQMIEAGAREIMRHLGHWEGMSNTFAEIIVEDIIRACGNG